MSTDREAIVTHLCRCGDPIKQIDLHEGPFPTMTGTRWWWVHVDKDRNLSHQARMAGGPRHD